MKNVAVVLFAPLRIFALGLFFGAFAGTAGAQLVAPDEPVAGKSQEDWSRAWWQWAGSFDADDSPIADQTGALCMRGQSGEVWFLAGTYGTRRTVRTCTIPRGKHLFFPLINYMALPTSRNFSQDDPVMCSVALSDAARLTEGAFNLILEVDGRRHDGLLAHRQATRSCFDIGVLAHPPVHAYPAAANGYYVMLRPLAPGRHTLNFGGALPTMLQGVTYTLLVE